MVYKTNNKNKYGIWFTYLTIKTYIVYCLQIKQQRQILQMVYKSNNKDRYCILFTNLTIKTDIAYGLQI